MEFQLNLMQNALMARELLLLSCLGRGLAHQLRTDLSVLVNELSYLKSQLSAGECDLALERCRRISDTLKNACDLSDTELKILKTSSDCITDVVSKVFGCEVGINDEISSFDLDLDPDKLEVALQLIADLYSSSVAASQDKVVPNFDLRMRNDLAELIFCWEGSAIELPEARKFESLTDLFCEALSRDTVAAPIADGILAAHGASIVTRAIDGRFLELVISFRRAL